MTSYLFLDDLPGSSLMAILILNSNFRRGAKLSKKVMETVKHYNAEDEEQQGQGMLQKWECYTVTRPRSSFIWAYLAVLVFLFFMFPLVILVLANNVPGKLLSPSFM